MGRKKGKGSQDSKTNPGGKYVIISPREKRNLKLLLAKMHKQSLVRPLAQIKNDDALMRHNINNLYWYHEVKDHKTNNFKILKGDTKNLIQRSLLTNAFSWKERNCLSLSHKTPHKKIWHNQLLSTEKRNH